MTAEAQTSIWTAWAKADRLVALGHLDEAATIRANADRAEDEFLWGGQWTTEQLSERKAKWLCRYESEAA